MQNLVFLIGRLVNDPELKISENEKKFISITVAVQRSFKNSNGIYESDFIKCKMWNAIASNVKEFCKKGDLIGIKGRIQNNDYIDSDNNKKYTYEIIADKVSFLSSKRQETE